MAHFSKVFWVTMFDSDRDVVGIGRATVAELQPIGILSVMLADSGNSTWLQDDRSSTNQRRWRYGYMRTRGRARKLGHERGALIGCGNQQSNHIFTRHGSAAVKRQDEALRIVKRINPQHAPKCALSAHKASTITNAALFHCRFCIGQDFAKKMDVNP